MAIKKVGFVGVGNMGNPMAMNMVKKGFALTVYDLNANAMKNLVAAGAKGAASAAEVVKASNAMAKRCRSLRRKH
mgnify:CR=1 FL=1